MSIQENAKRLEEFYIAVGLKPNVTDIGYQINVDTELPKHGYFCVNAENGQYKASAGLGVCTFEDIQKFIKDFVDPALYEKAVNTVKIDHDDPVDFKACAGKTISVINTERKDEALILFTDGTFSALSTVGDSGLAELEMDCNVYLDDYSEEFVEDHFSEEIYEKWYPDPEKIAKEERRKQYEKLKAEFESE